MRNPIKEKPPAFRVGDRVWVPFGGTDQKAIGVISEIRGAIGRKGQRLYQVSIPQDPYDSILWELFEDELELAPEPDYQADELTKQRILDYLKNGGLGLMLLVQTPRGQYQPRVWLCFNSLGNVTHTFAQERGLVGGGVVPSGAWSFGRVFKPKVGEVGAFLEHFGLSRKEAEQLVHEIGTTR
jgi:hypothetical protein